MAFTPLKAALGALIVIYTNYKVSLYPLVGVHFSRLHLQETTAVKDKIEAILSRIAKLEEIFKVPAGDEAGEKRRSELLRYAIVLLLASALTSFK